MKLASPALPTALDLGLVAGPGDPRAARPVPDAAATPTPVPIEVIFEDEILLVVNKPAGLATMPRGRYVARSVIAQLRWARGEAALPANRRLVAAHRLDRLTSGVLVLVKDPAWRGPIQRAFENQPPAARRPTLPPTAPPPTAPSSPIPPATSDWATSAPDPTSPAIGASPACGTSPTFTPATRVEKTYQALTTCTFTPSTYTETAQAYLPREVLAALSKLQAGPQNPVSSGNRHPIATAPGTAPAFDVSLPLAKPRGSWQTQITPDGKECRTRLRLAGGTEGAWAWELWPTSGFTHQLRVTLAALGYPIIGDPLYPAISPVYQSDEGDSARLYLHAARLALPPVNGPQSGGRRRWPAFTAPAPVVAPAAAP